jgi:phage anti-repressor protein
MTSLSFNRELAIALYESPEEFPIDFDDAWRWLGYSTKQKAESKLRNNFEEGLDFLTKGLKTSTGGRPSVFVCITVDCFKSLGMMAGTDQGKVIRKYFLECERIAKASAVKTPIALGAYTQRVESMFDNANKIPLGYWCVLHESANLLIWVESKLKLPVDKADLLDGSIGTHWSNYRKNKLWIGDRVKFSYKFPDGRWCNPWCYQMKELEHFRYFVEDTYKPVLMPKYLEGKYPSMVKV